MTEDAEARAARLRALSEEGATSADRRTSAREWAEKQVAAVRGTAASAEGDVRAVVDHAGLLLSLELSPLTRQAKQEDLAHAITLVVRQATADARTQVREVYVKLQNEGAIKALPPFLLPAPEVGAVSLSLPSRGGKPRRAGDQAEEGPPDSWLREDPW